MGTINDITKTQKNACQIWFGLAIPAANETLVLDADGRPNATANPNAKLVGLSEKGAQLSISKSFTEEFYDEYKYPLEKNLDQSGMSIKVDAAQILDFDLMEAATAGVGTKVAGATTTPASGFTAVPIGKLTIGEAALVYTGIAVIAPTKNNPNKFVVFHIYKGFQNANVDFALARQERSKISLEFVGVAITSRAITDSTGAYWSHT